MLLRPITFVLLLVNSACYGEVTDWVEVEDALREYANYPSSENANRASSALPLEHAQWGEHSPASRSSEFIYDSSQFSMLSHQVAVGHSESVRLAFKLFSISDGAFTEDLQVILGGLVRSHPELFLRELIDSSISQIYFDGLVLNDGAAFVDRLAAQCLEARRKADALNTVSDGEFAESKERLISIIDEFVSALCK